MNAVQNRIIQESRLGGWELTAPGIWRRTERLVPVGHEIVRTLFDHPPWLPAAFLYDARGSQLFETISTLPEYYQTRTEEAILEEAAETVMRRAQPCVLVELGAGSSKKTRHLLREMLRICGGGTFVPVDVSGAALLETQRLLADELPELQVQALEARYESALHDADPFVRKTFVFLGGTVGNFSRGELLAFFSRLSASMAPGDCLLLGVDRVKDPAVLEAAYHDSRGVTAEFILNAFRNVNRLTGSDFDLEGMRYLGRYDEAWQRVEMVAVASRDQRVRFPGLGLEFQWAKGRGILVEISRKFDPARLGKMLRGFDLETVEHFSDPREYFSVLLLEKRGGDQDGD